MTPGDIYYRDTTGEIIIIMRIIANPGVDEAPFFFVESNLYRNVIMTLTPFERDGWQLLVRGVQT